MLCSHGNQTFWHVSMGIYKITVVKNESLFHSAWFLWAHTLLSNYRHTGVLVKILVEQDLLHQLSLGVSVCGWDPPQIGSIPVPEKLVSVRVGYRTRLHQRERNLDGLNTLISRKSLSTPKTWSEITWVYYECICPMRTIHWPDWVAVFVPTHDASVSDKKHVKREHDCGMLHNRLLSQIQK